MEIIYNMKDYSGEKGLYLALGNFDGIHRGHQAVIRSAVSGARACGALSGVLLFNPHPSMLLYPERQFCLLTGMEERSSLMAELGVDHLFVEPFNVETASLSPEAFVKKILLEKYKIKGVSIGDDYSFGRGASGRKAQMRNYGKNLGFEVTVCSIETALDQVISSSAIKKLLGEGEVEQASLLLNYYFHRRGKIVAGEGRGKMLLFPTANIVPAPHLVWPGGGVYLTAVGGLDGKVYFGLTNVGTKPTFNDGALTVETYIIDFEGDLYGREIVIYFLMRLRDTLNFSTTAFLREQICEDIRIGKELARKRFADIASFVEPVRFIRPYRRGKKIKDTQLEMS